MVPANDTYPQGASPRSWMAVMTSVASAVAFAFMCNCPAPFMWAEPDNLANVATFLVVAFSTNDLVYLARARAVEAAQRRREAEARIELTASRARIVAAADDARRRLERDLHDGAQQQLVSLGIELRMAEAFDPR